MQLGALISMLAKLKQTTTNSSNPFGGIECQNLKPCRKRDTIGNRKLVHKEHFVQLIVYYFIISNDVEQLNNAIKINHKQ